MQIYIFKWIFSIKFPRKVCKKCINIVIIGSTAGMWNFEAISNKFNLEFLRKFFPRNKYCCCCYYYKCCCYYNCYCYYYCCYYYKCCCYYYCYYYYCHCYYYCCYYNCYCHYYYCCCYYYKCYCCYYCCCCCWHQASVSASKVAEGNSSWPLWQ